MNTLEKEFKEEFNINLKDCINPLTGFCLKKLAKNIDPNLTVSQLKVSLSPYQLILINKTRLTHNF